MTAIPDNVFGALKVQYSTDNATWHDFGIAHSLGAIIVTRRFAIHVGQTVTARYWRVIATGGTDFDTAVMRADTIGFMLEDATLNPNRTGAMELMAFNYDDADQRFIMPVTAYNVDVWNLGAWQCSIAGPYSGNQASSVGRTQLLDTMLTFHQDVAPQRIMRQGAPYEWDVRALPFDSLPIYDYTGLKAGGVNAVQALYFIDYGAGDTFNITFEGSTSGPIAYSASGATLAASIVTAMEAMPNVGAGNVSATSPATDEIDVTFIDKLGASDVATMAPVTLHSTAGGVSVANLVDGKAGGEPIISATRGWPGSGVFYQQRLFLAALKSRPETFLGSQIGAYFSFDTTGATEGGALNENIDTNEVTAVTSIFAGRHLQLFTNSAEFYFPSEPITPPTGVKQSTQRGSAASIPPVMMDRATIFVGPGGDTLYDFEFEFLHDNYEAVPLSAHASHIVNGVIDLGFRKHMSTSEADMAVMPRANGDAVVMVALRDQEVTGFVPWTTQGRFLAAVGDLGGDLYVATVRTLGDGSLRRFLEKVNFGGVLDCSVSAAADDDRIVDQTWTGSAHLEGLTVSLYIDGSDAGDAVVTDGVVPLPHVPLRTIEVGLNYVPTGVTLPFVFQNDPRAGASMRPSVGEMAFRLGPTSNLMAGLVGGRLYRVPLKTRPNALLDQGPGESPFTGWTRLTMVPGLRPDAQLTFTQPRPGPLMIQEIVATARS